MPRAKRFQREFMDNYPASRVSFDLPTDRRGVCSQGNGQLRRSTVLTSLEPFGLGMSGAVNIKLSQLVLQVICENRIRRICVPTSRDKRRRWETLADKSIIFARFSLTYRPDPNAVSLHHFQSSRESALTTRPYWLLWWEGISRHSVAHCAHVTVPVGGFQGTCFRDRKGI